MTQGNETRNQNRQSTAEKCIFIYNFIDFIVLFFLNNFIDLGRRGVLMASELDSGSSGPGSSPGQGHCVVFLGKTLYPHEKDTQVYK